MPTSCMREISMTKARHPQKLRTYLVSMILAKCVGRVEGMRFASVCLYGIEGSEKVKTGERRHHVTVEKGPRASLTC